MNVLSTQYSIETESLDIYLAGCNAPHCQGCFNPSSWDFNQGEAWDTVKVKIEDKLKDFSMIKNVFVLGGEPLDQDRADFHYAMLDLDRWANLYGVKLWLYTRYDLSITQGSTTDDTITMFWRYGLRKVFDYIKCGEHKPELTTEDNIQYGVKLATSNQRIYCRGTDY